MKSGTLSKDDNRQWLEESLCPSIFEIGYRLSLKSLEQVASLEENFAVQVIGRPIWIDS